jgi:hypothetical protein
MDEANKINSSLMVLGQCMRILRNNQKKLSKTHQGGRSVRTEIPPYRMSKLTELFQEFFEGRGRAVRSFKNQEHTKINADIHPPGNDRERQSIRHRLPRECRCYGVLRTRERDFHRYHQIGASLISQTFFNLKL